MDIRRSDIPPPFNFGSTHTLNNHICVYVFLYLSNACCESISYICKFRQDKPKTVGIWPALALWSRSVVRWTIKVGPIYNKKREEETKQEKKSRNTEASIHPFIHPAHPMACTPIPNKPTHQIPTLRLVAPMYVCASFYPYIAIQQRNVDGSNFWGRRRGSARTVCAVPRMTSRKE